MSIDRESIDVMSHEEQTDLLAWLEDLVEYVRLKLGLTDQERKQSGDPVGDVVIQDHKQKQERASAGRKASGWTNLGFGKVDDKHV